MGAVLGVALPLLGAPLAWWLLLVLFGLAQLWAALWATRDHAPLRLARGMVAVLGCGTLALLAWVTLIKALTSCLPGGRACAPLPDTGQLRLAMLGVSLTSAPAWLVFAAVVAVTAALRRRRPVRAAGPWQGPAHSSVAKAARSSSRKER